MSFTICRRAVGAGLALALATSVSAQETGALSLEEALRLSGIEAADEVPTISDQEVGIQGPRLNPRIASSLADAAAACALVEQARLQPNFVVSLEVENFAGTGPYSGLNGSEYTLALAQQIELGGKRSARVRAATAQARVAGLRGELTVAELAQSVRSRYLSAVAAAATVELAADVLERNRELARIARVLVEVGREPPLRAMRAEAALAEAQANFSAAEVLSRAARAALATLWSDSGPPPPIPARFPDIQAPAEMLASTGQLRLELARAERRAAEAAIARERSLRVPDPVVSAGIRRSSEVGAQAFLVGVSVPLPFRDRNLGNIAAAQARLRAATAREAVVEADYEQEVLQARADYLAAQARVTTLTEASLPQAEEALRLVRIGYRNGRFPLIEVLSAAEARDDIRQSLIDAQETQGQAAAMLIRLAATQGLSQ